MDGVRSVAMSDGRIPVDASAILCSSSSNGAAMELRKANDSDIGDLAQLWYDGWRDAHERVVPAELTRLRTLESFRGRLPALLPQTRVAGPRGGILGFAALKADELYQLYVATGARGTG